MKNDKPAVLSDAEKQRLREIFREIPFVRFLGIELEEIERGSATLRLELRDELKRNGGITHGGVIASLIDSAAAFAVMSQLEPGKGTTTIDLTIQYLRPLTTGQTKAHARVLRAGRRVAVISIDVLDDAQTLAATALTSYLILS